jgi:hypothetical protein
MTVFGVGEHEVKVWQDGGRWGVAVDGAVHRHWFRSEAQAAGAGLLRAHRLDRAREREEARR